MTPVEVRNAAIASAKPAAQEGVEDRTSLLNWCRLIVSDAVPATASGATCFVPRYQLDHLRKLLESAHRAKPVGEVDEAMVERLAEWFTRNATVWFRQDGRPTTADDYREHARAALTATTTKENNNG